MLVIAYNGELSLYTFAYFDDVITQHSLFFQRFDPKWVDPDGMTYEEYQAAMDKMWTRMAEPDGEGIDLHPYDPRRQFIATSEGVIFSQAPP
jgi:hypothetical protein